MMRKIFGTLAASMLLALQPATALADAPTPLPQPSAVNTNALGACLASGQVWLLVVDETGRVHANQCVGVPGSGIDALRAGGMAVRESSGGYVCTIDDHPSRCPRGFDGTFWNYLHGTPGKAWERSTDGAADHVPTPGTVEAWCRNTATSTQCTPPTLAVVADGVTTKVGDGQPSDLSPVVHAPVRGATSTGIWTLAGAGLLVAGVAARYLLARRRPAGTDDLPTR